jgi:origin recognition complex subunit 2
LKRILYLGQLSISAVEHVIESLTPNARRIFRLLVEAFLANSNSKDYEGKNINRRLLFLIIFSSGMKLTELYEQCKRSFYVNNEQNLRLQLIEFIDHRLIKLSKSTNDGQEIVRLLLAEQDIVKQLLDKLN